VAPRPGTDARSGVIRTFVAWCRSGFFSYGGLVAMQTLWAGPWLVKVAGYTSAAGRHGLFWINLSMLCTFWGWGFATPWLARRGIGVDRLIARGLPLSLLLLAIIIMRDRKATTVPGRCTAYHAAFVSLAQPAVAWPSRLRWPGVRCPPTTW
jgi:pimeloyl-ACP methyl ester carboxylesterase